MPAGEEVVCSEQLVTGDDEKTQIRLKYKYNYTGKDKKYTNTKIQTHTNTNFAIGTLSQIGGGGK